MSDDERQEDPRHASPRLSHRRRRAAEARPRAELDGDLGVAEFRAADVDAEFQVLPGHLSSGSAALLLSNDLLRSNLCGVVRAQVDERFPVY